MTQQNNINQKENFITNIEQILSPHIGKFGIGLSLLGGTASVLLGFGITVPASVVMGICNVGIFAGGICFERIQQQNKELINDNISLKQDISRRKTILENFKFVESKEDEEMTNINSETNTIYEPVYHVNS